MTARLNQDCLENLFSHLRYIGHTSHPSPVQAIQKLKMILVGSNPQYVIQKPSVQNIDFSSQDVEMKVNLNDVYENDSKTKSIYFLKICVFFKAFRGNIYHLI